MAWVNFLLIMDSKFAHNLYNALTQSCCILLYSQLPGFISINSGSLVGGISVQAQHSPGR